ncbi:hypothetical protein Q8F55_004011 [Vanrija albida]|uniref:C-CAP/cofactor C-like domain-containing protein n=1 Tax=Vanrija albida TaxID=181172 RepID=A0ABR3Q5J3_9TREE
MASTSAAAEFYASFQAAKADITTALGTDPTRAGARLTALRAELAAALPTLPAYDQRSLELQVRELEAALKAVREKERPKAKFAFKRAGASKPAPPAPPPAPAAPTTPPPAPAAQATTYTLSSRANARLTAADYAPHTESYTLTLSSLSRCVVDLRASAHLTSLHAHDLRECVVLAPVLGGSAMLSGLTRCVLLLGAQQFRLHASSETAVFLHVGSLPVIEGCSAVFFGPHPAREGGQYAQVQDFDWVRAGKSPHFSVLADAGALGGLVDAEAGADAGAIVDQVLAAVRPAA